MDGSASAFGWPLLVATGVVSGFCSGLLGMGGGLVIVPALVFVLPHLGVGGPELVKVAMATSLALIIPTGIASVQAHAARGTIDWPFWALLAPSLVAGSLLATVLVPVISVSLVTLLFAGFALLTAWRLARGEDGADTRSVPARFNPWVNAAKSVAAGMMATLLGFGVAFFAVALLSRFIALPRAIATATALTLPVAIGGAAGYLFAAPPAGCPSCAGYVFLPAVAAIGIASVLAVPLGALLTQVAPVSALRKGFALMLVLAAVSLARKQLPGMVAEARGLFDMPRFSLAGAEPARSPAWLARRPVSPVIRLAARLGPRRGLVPLLPDRQPAGWLPRI
jgi:uncharacterized protein